MAKTEDGRVIKEEDRTVDRMGGSPSTSKSRQRVLPRKTWTAWLVTNILRIATWTLIVTIIFRCPSDPSLLKDNHPAACKPYLSFKSFAEPYVGPYYETYAGPYVEKARPYVETANTKIIKPATVLAIDKYNQYAAPEIAKAKDFTWSKWEQNGLPQIRKAQDAAQQVYDENLAPHVQKASDAASPYYESARTNALNVHENHILPAIAYSQPHIYTAYTTCQKFVIEKAIPFAQHAWTHLVIFTDGTLWPFVKKVYADNVRPQVVMIGERIAKYQEGRKLQSAIREVDTAPSSSSTIPQAETEAEPSVTSSSTSPTTETSTTSSSTVAAAPTQRVATEESVVEDLVKWQQKFAIAADKGTDDLRERIGDIVASILKSDIGEGQGLATALEKTCDVEIDAIKAKIKSVASSLPDESDQQSDVAAEKEIVQAIRDAGGKVKERAQQVRSWADRFRAALKQRTELATDSTLQVLDDIRDLGLQEIGMRWAWTDGITYKHWQKYHDLKKKFADWRLEVREIALSHEAIADAREQVERTYEESMATTETAAKELIRLRDVAKWKIAARDATDDFETRAIPIAAAAASSAASVAKGIKDAIVGSASTDSQEVASAASATLASAGIEASEKATEVLDQIKSLAAEDPLSVGEAAASVSSAIYGTTGTIESLASAASSSADSVASSASEGASSVLSEAGTALQDASSIAASAIQGSSTGSIESLASSLSGAAESVWDSATDSASSLASSATLGPSDGVSVSASVLADSVSLSASSAVASASASEALKEKIAEAGDNVAEFTSSISAGSD